MTEREKPVLLATGGSGLCGRRFVSFGEELGMSISAPSHKELDIAGMAVGEIARIVKKFSPLVVVNFAAITDVDGCEAERGNKEGLVWLTNTEGPLKLAQVCRQLNVTLVHISTDYVLGGEGRNTPHLEDEKVLPVAGWYSQTKAQAERELNKMGGRVHIVRIELPFTDELLPKKDFPRLVSERLAGNQEFFAIVDQQITPLYVDDCARAIAKIAGSSLFGIWHVATPTITTPYELANMVVDATAKHGLKLDRNLIGRTKFASFAKTRPAPRPQHNAFDIPNGRFVKNFGDGVLRTLDVMLDDWAKRFVPSFLASHA